MDQLDNGPVGGIIRFNSSSRPVVEAQYQGRCFAYINSDQAISAGNMINWLQRLYDAEGVYAAGVVFVASRSGLWRFNATIQLNTSSIVRFVVAGSRYYDFQANGTQATCITLDVLLSSNDQVEMKLQSSATLKGGSGTSGSPYRSFVQTLFLGA